MLTDKSKSASNEADALRSLLVELLESARLNDGRLPSDLVVISLAVLGRSAA
jgi:hypothetical protein